MVSNTSEKIQEEIRLLDQEWFSAKKKYFRSETFYNRDMNMIHDEFEEIHTYGDEFGKCVEEKETIVIKITLLQYAWNDSLPSVLESSSAYEHKDKVVNGRDVAAQVFGIIDRVVRELVNDDLKYNFINAQLETVGIAIEHIKKVKVLDEEHREVLNDFSLRLTSMVFKEYSSIFEAMDYFNYQDKLEFNISLDELAALLYLLNEAEIFKADCPGDTRFLKFGKKYFYFKNQKFTETLTRAKNLESKFSKARAEQPPALGKIKMKLLAVLTN